MKRDRTARLLTHASRLDSYTAGIAAVIVVAVVEMIGMPALASILQGVTP